MKPSGVSRRHKSPGLLFHFQLGASSLEAGVRGFRPWPGHTSFSVSLCCSPSQDRFKFKDYAKLNMEIDWALQRKEPKRFSLLNFLSSASVERPGMINSPNWNSLLFIIPLSVSFALCWLLWAKASGFCFLLFQALPRLWKATNLGHLRGQNKHLEEESVPFATFAKIFAEWSTQDVAKGGMFPFQGISLRG